MKMLSVETKNKQEQRLKCRNTIGGLEVSIRQQIVNTLDQKYILVWLRSLLFLG